MAGVEAVVTGMLSSDVISDLNESSWANCESQVCPSGVSPNIERLCFSGNRDALLDSHLSTLGEHIDTVKSPSGPVLTLSSSSGDRCHNLKELDVSDSTKLTALTIATVRASI